MFINVNIKSILFHTLRPCHPRTALLVPLYKQSPSDHYPKTPIPISIVERRRREIIEPTLKVSECEPRRVGSGKERNKPRKGRHNCFLNDNVSTQRGRARLQPCVKAPRNKSRPRTPPAQNHSAREDISAHSQLSELTRIHCLVARRAKQPSLGA